MKSNSPLVSSPEQEEFRARPAERVLRYLESEFDRQDLDPGARIRLPSVRDLAIRLGVSSGTVQAVFQRLAREGRVTSEVGSGTYFIARSFSGKVVRIGVNIGYPESAHPSNWTCQIYGGILHGVLHAAQPVVLQPLPHTGPEDDPVLEEMEEHARGLDGVILFPHGQAAMLLAFFERHGKPAVNLNPPHEGATADFISPDYFSASRFLGKVWRQCGRRKIAVMIAPSLASSVSVRLRTAGLLSGLGEDLGDRIQVRVVPAADGSERSGGAAFEKLVSSGYRPDAVYCAGDDLAQGVLRVCLQAGLAIPGEIGIVGGNGMARQGPEGHELTVMEQPLSLLGEELIRMMVAKIRHDRHAVPGIFLPARFHCGSTTSPEENEIIRQRSSAANEEPSQMTGHLFPS